MPEFPYARNRNWVNRSEGYDPNTDPTADANWFEALERNVHALNDADKASLYARHLVDDYVGEGFLPAIPSPASLAMSTPAGMAYLGGLRIEKAADPHTYAASQDTYVDILADGSLSYSGVANGVAEPALAAGALRLFRVVTDAAGVTAVEDRRDLQPTLRGGGAGGGGGGFAPVFASVTKGDAQQLNGALAEQLISLSLLPAWMEQHYDPGGIWADASDRFVPNVAGWWRFSAAMSYGPAEASATYRLALWKNGARHVFLDIIQAGSAINPMCTGSFVALANGTTDYFDLRGSHNASGATYAQGNYEQCYFQAELVKAA